MKKMYDVTREIFSVRGNEYISTTICDRIFISENLEEAKAFFNTLKSGADLQNLKNGVKYVDYLLSEQEVDEDGDYVGCAECLDRKIVEYDKTI
jgi:hypothetical protein